MGRNGATISKTLMEEEHAFMRFRQALKYKDQLALDDLYVTAKQHLSAVAFSGHILPFEMILVSMLLEEHKKVMKLEGRAEFTCDPVGLLAGGEKNGI